MTPSEITLPVDNKKQQYLELAVPVFSFGATFAGVLIWRMGFPISFQLFAIGCVISSCILAYLAYNRPRKDIVALSTPIYAFIFFAVPPDDYMSGLMLQLLYAVSLTLLLVRLKYRFGSAHTAVTLGQEMAVPVKAYLEKTRHAVSGVSPETAHRAALVISQFSAGEYAQAALSAGSPGLPGPEEELLGRAFAIVHEHAILLEGSRPRPGTHTTFLPEDESLLAKPLLPEFSEERRSDTLFDDAMLLLFCAAWIASEADRPHLLACQGFLQKLLE